MKTVIRILLLGALLSLSFVVLGPAQASADDYWTNHWNWYDNTYQPYYYRNYSYSPGYSGYYAPGYTTGYAPGYYAPGYYNNYGYGYTPYGTYYGAPGLGVGRVYGGGSAVNVGPMRFGWR